MDNTKPFRSIQFVRLPTLTPIWPLLSQSLFPLTVVHLGKLALRENTAPRKSMVSHLFRVPRNIAMNHWYPQYGFPIPKQYKLCMPDIGFENAWRCVLHRFARLFQHKHCISSWLLCNAGTQAHVNTAHVDCSFGNALCTYFCKHEHKVSCDIGMLYVASSMSFMLHSEWQRAAGCRKTLVAFF